VKITSLLLTVVLSLPMPLVAQPPREAPTRHLECVVLLHGLWRSALSMKALEWGLSEAGFAVVNPSYPSLSHPIQELARIAVDEGLAGCREQGLGIIHFVTHSLGGILVRQYLAYGAIPGLHRVVMLGPPNQGSQVADFIASVDALELVMPDIVEQLGTGEKSIPRQLGPVTFELGIIAGTSNGRAMLPGFPEVASDGTVAVAETIVPGMLDFLEMPVGHTFMMWNEAVLEQVIHFLSYGAFDRDEPLQ